MKGIFIILDGIGDLPCRVLNGMTPLEAADTPNLDFFSVRGEMGYVYPVRPGFVPESDEAVISLFGNNLIDSTRGQLEARGTDLKLTRGDLALRCNFATIDSLKKGNILDRRGGRTLTTSESEILAKALNKITLPCKFTFKPTVQHRGVLVLKGGFSDNISGNDFTYLKGKSLDSNKVKNFKALDDDENTHYTINILNEFIEKAFKVLEEHPLNIERKKKGLLPANFLLMRGAGIEPPKLKFYKKWLSVAYMPLEIGFSRVSGMGVFSFDYPKMKSLDSYENLRKGLKKACDFSIKTIKRNHKNFDYAYIHIKETDLPGHDNKPLEKKSMIETIDSTLFKFLRGFAPQRRIKIAVTGDHSTPCNLKVHSSDPVPLLFYEGKSILKKRISNPFVKIGNQKIFFGSKKNKNINQEKTIKFCERNARNGSMGKILGKDLFEKIGFLK